MSSSRGLRSALFGSAWIRAAGAIIAFGGAWPRAVSSDDRIAPVQVEVERSVAGKPGRPADNSKAPVVSASGFVIDSEGRPVTGAIVHLRQWSPLHPGQRSLDEPRDRLAMTRTDARGVFTFTDVPAGPKPDRFRNAAPWDVIVVSPGYGIDGRHLPSPRTPAPLTIGPSPAMSVGGRVVDGAGRAIGHVEIRVTSIADLDADPGAGPDDPNTLHLQGSETVPQVRSDADGRFRLEGLPAGKRIGLSFRHDDYVTGEAFVATTSESQPALTLSDRDAFRPKLLHFPRKTVEVRQGAFIMRLEPGYRLTGRVVATGTRTPLAGARVRLDHAGWHDELTADAEGRFAFSGLPAPEGMLEVRGVPPHGHVSRVTEIAFPAETRLLAVEPSLPGEAMVEGIVVAAETGRGIENVTVADESFDAIDPRDRVLSSPTRTDAEGRFRLFVPRSKRVIRIRGNVRGLDLPPDLFDGSASRTDTFVPRPAELRFVRIVDITGDDKAEAGPALEPLRFEVSRRSLIAGFVTGPDGKPVVGAEVVPATAARRLTDQTTRSDDEGRFDLKLPGDAGPFTLTAIDRTRKLIGEAEVPDRPNDAADVALRVDVRLKAAARIVGTVTDGAHALAGISVHVYEVRGSRGDPQREMFVATGTPAMTDKKGRFAIELAQPDRKMHLVIRSDGFRNVTGDDFEVKPGGVFDHPVIVLKRLTSPTTKGVRSGGARSLPKKESDAEALAPVALSGTELALLEPDEEGTRAEQDPPQPAPRGGRVLSSNGVVIDRAGKPMAGVTVHLREWSQFRTGERGDVQDVLATVTTDEQGRFEFRNVPWRPFSTPWPVRFPWDVVAVQPGRGIAFQHLVGAESPQPVYLQLAPEAIVSGRVVDERGDPLRDVAVVVSEIQPLGEGKGGAMLLGLADEVQLLGSQVAPRTRTTADGRFRLAGLPQSRRIVLKFDDGARIAKSVYAVAIPGQQTDLRVPRGDLDVVRDHNGEFTVTLQRGRRLTGRVVLADSGRPYVGGAVSLGALETTTDAEGRFAIDGIPSPRATLFVEPPENSNYLGLSVGVDFGAKRELDLPLTLAKGIALTGTVVDADSQTGVEGAEVSVDERRAETISTNVSSRVTTDRQGRFRLPVVPGRHTIRLSGHMSEYDLPDHYALAQPSEIGPFVRRVDVPGDKPPPELRFEVTHGLVVVGVISDPDGAPLEGAEVRSTQPTRPGTERVAWTNAQGRFRLTGFPVREAQKLRIVHQKKELIGRIEVPGLGITDPRRSRAVAVPLRLKPAGRITGRVTDGFRPVVGARMTFSEVVARERQALGHDLTTIGTTDALTDAEGRYTFELIDPTVSYIVAGQAARHGAATVIDKDGRSLVLNIGADTFRYPEMVMRRLDTAVSGVVVDPGGRPVAGVTVEARNAALNQPNPLVVDQAVTDREGRFLLAEVPNVRLTLVVRIDPPTGAPAGTAARRTSPVDALPGDEELRLVTDPP